MDSNDIEISKLCDREYAQGIPPAAIIDLAKRWIFTGHYYAQSMCFPSDREPFELCDFLEVSRFFGIIAEANEMDSGSIADIAERASHGIEVDEPLALKAIVIVQRLISRLSSDAPTNQSHDVPALDDIVSVDDESHDMRSKQPIELIDGDDRSWRVGGKKKIVDTFPQHKVVQALVDAGPDGLTLDRLRSVAPGCRDILKTLRRDPDWKAVIKLAGKPGGRYRIVPSR
jgi:hypothetical protein